MATLILTTVGTALGGPIGGMIGAALGQRIDSELFKPKGRHGPRLGELAVQTSSYGTPIPKLFGKMRVAGTVIWATDLQEDRTTSGGGKGRPRTTSYSYSASLAVALSARPIRNVGRIWADGKLLRGTAGDFKSRTEFRLYRGSEDQAVDPLIASVEGAGRTSAFRGTAYAVFEDLELADYGNRIPSLTFEVEADAQGVAIGRIAEELSDGAIAEGVTPRLDGYAASGDSVRGAIELLGETAGLSLIPLGLQLLMTGDAGPELPLPEAGAGAAGVPVRPEIRRRAADLVPSEVTITYYDPARDYQTGLQRATHGGPALRAEQRTLPAALGAAAAKGFAQQRLAALWAGRAGAKLHFPPRLAETRPGARVGLHGQAGRWKVKSWTLERMVVTLELTRLPPELPEPLDASAGRTISDPDQQHGPTTLFLFDLPIGGEQPNARPILMALAAGTEEGWRRAQLSMSLDGGSSWAAAGATAAPAVLGRALGPLPPLGSELIDRRSDVVVELLNEGMWLEGRDDAALANGANLAVIGDELVQFGSAEPLGERRFRLSRLLRGRRGTEWAAIQHAAGEPFALLAEESVAAIELPLGSIGAEARLLAAGIGDAPQGEAATREATGEAVRPPSPVHLRASRVAGGDLLISWVRRSRGGWNWLSGSDTPLVEESENYRLVLGGAGFERAVTVASPSYAYTAQQQSEDELVGPLAISVVQLGTVAPSRPAQLTVG